MSGKVRYCAFLVYPDSAPLDWWEKLRKSHGSYARSPLHFPDSDEGEGKSHYHVIYCHGNTASVDAMRRVIPSGIAANDHLEAINCPRNYQRYLLHLDDPEKQQFSGNPKDLIEVCNGFPLDLTRDFSQEERVEQRRKIFAIIRENGVSEYADLLDSLDDAGMFDLFDFACNHSILYCHYLSSIRGRLQKPE